jgi:hypothetical protein
MADIFLAYSRLDKEVADEIASQLIDAGFNIFTNEGLGISLSERDIEYNIRKSICLVVILTAHEKNSFLNAHISFAQDIQKPILPILIDGDAQSNIPFGLRYYQYLDFRHSRNYEILVDEMKQFLPLIPIDSSKIAKVVSQKSPLKIFISYQRDNQDIIENLVALLGRMGHTVWYDQHITGGHQWWESILIEIQKCDLFITAVSPTYLDSEACRLEYGYAHDLHKRILPIEIVAVGSYYELPTPLQAINIVKLLEITASSETMLIEVFDKLPKPSAMPKRLPTPPKMPVHPLSLLKDQAEAKNLGDSDAQLLLITKIEEYLFSDNANDKILAHKLLVNLKKRKDIFHAGGEKITRLLNRYKD